MEKCLYCASAVERKDFDINSNADISRVVSLLSDMGNGPEIIFSIKGTAYGVNVEFCPKCGRRLKKGCNL